MDAITSYALASGLSWASGIRLYATLCIVGLLAKYGYITLPESLELLTHPMVIAISGLLMVVEFFADKIPYVDSVWDSLQTFIRIPAGAVLAMAAMNSTDPMIATIAALLGGSLTGITHATKAGSRALINTSPEPVSNITTSFAEEGLLLGGGWLALLHPAIFLGILGLLIVLMIWMLPKLWRGVRQVINSVRGLFSANPS
ncbi:MAG TPA: DUF4126 domain-containing protein [Methylophilus sp.]